LSSLLLVPAKGREELLAQKVAGLSLAQRLYHHARKAGINRTCLVMDAEGEHSKLQGLESCLPGNFSTTDGQGLKRCIVVQPGMLPDISCLAWLKEIKLEEHEVLELPGIFVFLPSATGFELQKAFEENGYFRLLDFLKTFLKSRPLRCEAGQIFDLTRPENRPRVEKQLFRGLIKDTEGFMSRFVERPISIAISRRLVNTPVTPNQITVISILIGLLGAWFISIHRGFWQVLGSLLFLLHSIVDGCDGEIARIKFMESRLGGILDFWGDNIVHAAVFAAIGMEWWKYSGSVVPLFLSAIAVAGTILCALLVYISTMRKKTDEGPLYTSVSTSGKKARLVRIADYLSRRDFIYLVVILSFYQHLDWFLIASAVGTMGFLAILVWIRIKDA
jgi:phosphatidylglycerophosphate synthase